MNKQIFIAQKEMIGKNNATNETNRIFLRGKLSTVNSSNTHVLYGVF